ncbi:MAG: SCP2 sterol-binding domain-containing protein [Proteobacteria bacterium]|nr:SCP2 sterol-binding domain-containing protein [Pseudomonadota bacterium]
MFTARLQALLNRQVEASPRAATLVGELAGKRVTIVARYTPWRLQLGSDGRSLLLTREAAGAADAVIAGTPLSLAALAGSDPEAVIRRGDVRIDGDVEVAARFRELGSLLYPDVEEELSRLIGDVPAHHFGVVARQGFAWLRQTLQTSTHNVAEYLAHESRDLVPRAEAEAFMRGVDTLRESADRLQARVDALDDGHKAS